MFENFDEFSILEILKNIERLQEKSECQLNEVSQEIENI